jgi:tetratricopeptide (TPR) repeat protein
VVGAGSGQARPQGSNEQRRRPRLAALLAGSLALLALLPSAAAQRRSQEERDRDEAREWYTSGREALEAGEPEVALAGFEQAYALYPHWASMVGMGLAYQSMGQAEQALVCFEQGLVEGGTEIPAAERTDVQTRIAILRAALPPPPPPLPPPPPPPPPDEAGDPTMAWFWGLLGTAGACGVTAVVTGSYALVLDREYHDPATNVARQDQIRPTGEALQVTTDVFLGLAGAAAIAAIIIVTVGLGDEDAGDAGSVAVTPAPAGTGLGLSLSF